MKTPTPAAPAYPVLLFIAEAWLAERRALDFPLLSPQAREAWLATAAEAGGQGQQIGIAQP
jgi:hypothetical protein